MRFVTYIQHDHTKIGALIDERSLVDLKRGYLDFLGSAEKSQRGFASSLKELLEGGETALHTAREILRLAQENLRRQPDSVPRPWLVPLESVRLMAPIPNPSKVVAIGQNYRDHCLEQNAPIPDRPIIFAKFPTAVIGPNEPIVWDPSLTDQVDFEAELGVVIGKRARHVPQEQAFDYIAGYVNANDVSARDLQFGDRQWVRGKSLDTFCPIGPYLVTKDEVPDPQNLAVRAILNGVVMQDSSTRHMIFSVAYLIEFITRAFILLPGDIILTGTPHGVGVFRDPKIFMQPGDTITIEVEHLGALSNPCRAERVA
ncbi:MAG: fumarylacetoacetate hydrolase family protein [Candidatus Vecturithrix sp.]|jgi:2-keto-4-pentenoate hydratase/2-oxohepta-3-ene-1,7-dioic acid hydratase in catechol pathway|nr:fumarylacetoacetate hydrolase family protein [Candidatus Vecturithrix sp.]